MDSSYTTTCPHCGIQISLPYQDLLRHTQQHLGKLSAAKRKGTTHLTAARKKRWQEYVHPNQEQLLELAKHTDLSALNYTEIADKIGMDGKARSGKVRVLITRLQNKGLLPPLIRERQRIPQALIELSKQHDLNQLSLSEIGRKIGATNPNLSSYIWHYLHRMEKKGLLPKWQHARVCYYTRLQELSQHEDVTRLPLSEIADKLGLQGKNRTAKVVNLMKKLYKE